VVAVLREVRLVDEPVVFDEVWVPLVCLATNETIEAIDPLLERPLLSACSRSDVLLCDAVILTHPEGAPTAVLKDLSNRSALIRDATVSTGKSICSLGDAGHAVDVMVSSGKHSGAGR
jgi:hypothetical protein